MSNISAPAQVVDQSSPLTRNESTTSVAVSGISGTVLDTNGDVIEGAHLQLSKTGSSGFLLQMNSGAMGQFEFANLEPGTYTVTVSRDGMTTFVSKPITLHSEAPVVVPDVVLRFLAATTSVIVMDKETASIEQVKIAEQQRVLKVFPNFYSSFDWNAPSMLPKQKYHLAVRTLIDPVTFLTTGAIAGVEQNRNVFPSFGGGISGYGKRYGAAFANQASGELLTRAIFPSMFHTDPRYFIMSKGSAKARALHAIASTFVTRGDNGSQKVNFAEILGDFSAAAWSNAYFPANERGVNLVLINGFGGLGGNMLNNLIREFVLDRLTTRGKHRVPADSRSSSSEFMPRRSGNPQFASAD
ncbi:MAG: carboxypeptidase regulatory-like domain-containing protein [Alphaproteobacteria bacterium]|nr:carboxypeptidase regulatory-like domain-containing protein [Alphaproteobacteria bacterium]